jgi:hypothetical protein
MMIRGRLLRFAVLASIALCATSRASLCETLTFDSGAVLPGGFTITDASAHFDFLGDTIHTQDGSAALWTQGAQATLSRFDGGDFTLSAFDGAEYFQNSFYNEWQYDSLHITVTGYRSDGSMLSATLVLDGVADGSAGSPDFQPFVLPSTFTELQSVTFSGDGFYGNHFALDNVVAVPVSTPEPSTLLTTIIGGCELWRRRIAERRASPPQALLGCSASKLLL